MPRMNKIFENAPGAELTQVTFWTLYKDTFTPYTDYPMLQAADIIRNVTIEFPEASASVVNDGGPGAAPRFVIQNIRRRLRPPSPFRFRCQWNGGTPCSEVPPDSPNKLYNHVLSHLERLSEAAPDDQMDTGSPSVENVKCHWATCLHEAASISALRQHILTHIPPSTPAPKNPCQPHAITLPHVESTTPGSSNAAASGAATATSSPLSRPPPPPPTSFVKFRGPPDAVRDPPSSTALLALYSVRMLFLASFADNMASAAPVHDGDRFGFPAIPSIQQDLEKEEKERGGKEVREAEKRGRKAFRSISSSLAEVHVGDPEIMWWVVDMIHRADESTDIPIDQT
jgi:chromatin structure-remodeling complex subunit RSC9